MLLVTAWLVFTFSTNTNADSKCKARGGSCKYTWETCSGGNYQSGLCSGASNRQCCLKDGRCTSAGGSCKIQSEGCSGSFHSGMCDGPRTRRCCIGRGGGGSSGSCSRTAKDYACRIMTLQSQSKINLKPDHFDSRGNSPYDGASARSNIKDTCNGRKAKRSNYCSNAKGGYVCLQANMVKNLYEYAVSFYSKYRQALHVNSLAGSCHSRTSNHYKGDTFDISCTTPRNHCSELVSFCRSKKAYQKCYPGGPCRGHKTWVHCSFH